VRAQATGGGGLLGAIMWTCKRCGITWSRQSAASAACLLHAHEFIEGKSAQESRRCLWVPNDPGKPSGPGLTQVIPQSKIRKVPSFEQLSALGNPHVVRKIHETTSLSDSVGEGRISTIDSGVWAHGPLVRMTQRTASAPRASGEFTAASR
jgi:hypothetical protein